MLPISSSGHLMLIEQWYTLKHTGFITDFINPIPLKIFYYFLHGPALFLLLIFFFTRWKRAAYSWSWASFLSFLLKVFVTDCITAFWYCVVHYFDIHIPLPLGFFITMLILIFSRFAPAGTSKKFQMQHAIILGCAQGFAFLPGISRLAITYSVCRWMNFESLPSFEIAWLIQLPLIIATWSYSVFFLVSHDGGKYLLNMPLALVIVSSSIIGWFALRLMVYAVQKNKVEIFAWYVLAPFLISLMLL